MPARNRVVFQLKIVGVLPADAVFALRQRDDIAFQGTPYRQQSRLNSGLQFQQVSLDPVPTLIKSFAAEINRFQSRREPNASPDSDAG